MKKNGVFLFLISFLLPEIFNFFLLCKLGNNNNNLYYLYSANIYANIIKCARYR